MESPSPDTPSTGPQESTPIPSNSLAEGQTDQRAAKSPPSRVSVGARRNPATEEAVLAAARDLLIEGGLSHLTMEAVAKRARAGKATLYRWWPSRGHLLLALYAQAKDTIPLPDTGTLKGDLSLYLIALVRHWQEAPDGQILRHLIAEAQSAPEVLAALKEIRVTRLRHFHTLVERAQARAELRAGIATEQVETRVAAQAWFWLMTQEFPDPQQMPAEIDVLFAPLLA